MFATGSLWEPRNYKRIPYCSLCGQRFTTDTSFRALIESQDQTAVWTPALTFREDGQTTELHDLYIGIHNYPRRKARYAPAVHSLCLSAVVDAPKSTVIYDIGLAMIPHIWISLPQEAYRSQGFLQQSIHSLECASANSEDQPNDDEYLELLKRCGQLPPELLTMIWDFIPPGSVRSILALQATKHLWSAPSTNGTATLSLCGDLILYYTHLMKQTYVCGIRQGDVVYGHESEHSTAVSIPSSKTAMIFTIEIHGLSQLEFVSEVPSAKSNKTTMSDSQFHGVIYPQTKELRVELKWDVFKIIDISPCDTSIFGHDFLWSSIFPPACPSADSFYNWPRHVDFSTHAQRLMEYIPLQSKEGKLYGLTAFCWSGGITGIGTHFRSCPHPSSRGGSASSTHWYGRQYGHPLHFRLDRQETMISMSVVWERISFFKEPYLAITTSKDETHYLGPYIEPSRICTKRIFNADDGDLQGLYYDKSPGLRDITSLGSIYQPHRHSVRRQAVSAIPLPRYMAVEYIVNPSTFFSQAHLGGVQSLVASYLETRCTGLLLCYHDGTERILGQWYQDTDKRPEYDTLAFREGSILRFYFAQGGRDVILIRVGIVQDVAAAAAAPRADETFVDMMEGDEIYWVFTNWADIIFAG